MDEVVATTLVSDATSKIVSVVIRSRAGRSARELITFVQDRAGHDWRYAIDAGKITRELGYSPRESFETGLQRTLDWYLSNEQWWKPLLHA